MSDIVKIINDRLAQTGQKLDANQTAFIEQELTAILARSLKVEYPELRGRSFVPLNGSFPRGAEYFKTKVYDEVGMASIITSQTTNLNELKVVAKEIVQELVEVAAVYEWTLRELEAAAFSNTPLDQLNANMARQAIETAIDSIIATGGTKEQPSEVTGKTGLLNNANVPSFTLSYNWLTASADEILEDLNGWANSVSVNSKTVFQADTMILSPYWFQKLSTQPYSTVVPDSILKVFVQNHPSVKTVDQWYYCTDFVSDGVDRGVVYSKKDTVLSFGNPVAFEASAPQIEDFRYKVPVRATVVPTQIFQPLGISYVDNADRTA